MHFQNFILFESRNGVCWYTVETNVEEKQNHNVMIKWKTSPNFWKDSLSGNTLCLEWSLIVFPV